MPPWRIQHKSLTCSEQSLRILMWNFLTCKTLQLHLTGMGRWKDPRKIKKLTSVRRKELEADTSLSTKPNRSHLDRLRKPCKIAWPKNKLFENGMVVLGLAASHDQKVKVRRYVGMISPDILPTHEKLRWQWTHDNEWATATCYDWKIDMTQEFEKRSSHTCWKSWKTGAHRHQQVEVLHLFRCFTHTHTQPAHTLVNDASSELVEKFS